MVVGFLLAILLDRNMRGASLLRTLIIMPVFISPIAMGLTWRFIFEPVSGLGQLAPHGVWVGKASVAHLQKRRRSARLMFVDCWQWTPFVALILLAGVQSISPEITEAARLDRIRGISNTTPVSSFPLSGQSSWSCFHPTVDCSGSSI